jgi:hypothetical protein
VRIRDLRRESAGNASVASAAIEWEDAARPSRRLSFSASGALASALEPAPEAFVLSAALAANRAGEKRLRVEARLCSVFADGLRGAFALLDAWYGGARAAMTIEAAGGFRARPRGAPVAAMFLSGGVDSLHMLRLNRRAVPRRHPESFRVALHAPSFGYTGDAGDKEARNLRERASRSVEQIAAEENLDLTVVNLESHALAPERRFFTAESHASLLAAAAHLFPGGLRSASIAASANLRRHPGPWGSHPLLDPLYGSGAVAIRHVGHEFSRLEKVRDLSDWDLAMATLIVCNESPLAPGVANCGRCEKCVRTLCELLAAGSLERVSTFPVRDIRAESIRRLQPVQDFEGHSWRDLPRELAGRPDLAAAIEDWMTRLRASADWWADCGWKGRLRRLDRKLFHGRLLALRRRWSEQS